MFIKRVRLPFSIETIMSFFFFLFNIFQQSLASLRYKHKTPSSIQGAPSNKFLDPCLPKHHVHHQFYHYHKQPNICKSSKPLNMNTYIYVHMHHIHHLLTLLLSVHLYYKMNIILHVLKSPIYSVILYCFVEFICNQYCSLSISL